MCWSFAPRIRAAILDRLRGDLAVLRSALAGLESVDFLEPEGGWAAVLCATHPETDKELVLDLLERAGVLVQPGYFFDFATDEFLMLSLLPEPGCFGGSGAAGGLPERSHPDSEIDPSAEEDFAEVADHAGIPPQSGLRLSAENKVHAALPGSPYQAAQPRLAYEMFQDGSRVEARRGVPPVKAP